MPTAGMSGFSAPSLGSDYIIDAQLPEEAVLFPVDPTVADVETVDSRWRDDESRDRCSHPANLRLRIHLVVEFFADQLQRLNKPHLVTEFFSRTRQPLSRVTARYLTRGMATHAIGNQAQDRLVERVRVTDRRGHRLAPDPATD